MRKVILILSVFLLLYSARSYGQGNDLPPQIKAELEEVLPKDTFSSVKLSIRLNKFIIYDAPVPENSITPGAADWKQGFVLFKKDYQKMVFYNYIPSVKETKVECLKIFAAPGEYEPMVLGVYPLAEGKVHVSVSSLKGPGGSIIPGTAVKVFAAKHLVKKMAENMCQIRPEMLKPENPVILRKGITRLIWMTIKIPEDAKAGNYEGEATLRNSSGEAVKVKIIVEVFPFKLLESSEYSVGWYGMPKDDESLAFAREYGCNAVDKGMMPDIVSASGSSVKLDFKKSEERLEQLKKLGMTANISQIETLGLSGFLMGRGYPELSPSFNLAFKNALEQIVNWSRTNKIRVGFWLVDEPREDQLNGWNRHLAETLKYIKLCNEVPCAISMVDPMGDTSGSKDYSVMSEVLKIMATHCWDGSKNLIKKAKMNKNCEVWFYNSGRTRLSFGFIPWKHRAKGRWEWAWAWEWTEKNARDINTWSSYQAGDPACGVVFPDKNGMMPSLALEMCREGVDDHKYIDTLEQAIAAANRTGKPVPKEAARKARCVLNDIEAMLPQYTEGKENAKDIEKSEMMVNEWRYQIAQEIIKVNNAMK